MTFTPDQYSQIAQGYDKAAADPLVPPGQRQEFAKKAEWFHFLERRGTGTQRSNGNSDSENAGLMSREILVEPPTSERPRRTMAPFLTALWITGAGLYLIGTLMFTKAVNLFGNEERQKPVTETSSPAEALPKVASAEPKAVGVEEKSVEQGDRQVKPAADRSHAISPDQPSSDSPPLIVPSAPEPPAELGSSSPSEPIQDGANVPSPETLMVTAAATIRNGPSLTAKKIGTATAGAELQLKARENEWVQFVDPSSGNTGWIRSSLVAPASRSAGKDLASQATEVPTAQPAKSTPVKQPAKSTPVKKRVRQVPTAPAQSTDKQRSYAELPADEGFLPPRRRGPGPLNKRRMLREGLMSPGFVPPQ